MFKKHYLVIILFAIIITGGFAACKKWVDVNAPLQVNENTVFSSEQGFREVMNGIYLKMADTALYGRELTFGLLSVVGRSYDTTITPVIKPIYYQGYQYNFQDPAVKASCARTWESMYQCIANLNYLLANLDPHQKQVGNNYNAIKGEALGLRAFLYFDLVRLFAPSLTVDPVGVSVPYITTVSPYSSPAAPTSAVIDSCIADLVTAQSLLPSNDVNVTHLTNWGVKGLLARIYLYKGDLVNAGKYAMSLISSKQFPMVSNNTDPAFQKEHLFSLYGSVASSLNIYKTVLSANPPLGFTTQNQAVLFTNGDYRKTFNDPVTNSTFAGALISPRKCNIANSNFLPLIRMSEMYYIAAESASALMDSVTATNLIDTVRVHRNLAKFPVEPLKRDTITAELSKEYQREFLGEGQVFYYYKRRNLPFNTLPFTKLPTVAGATYTFIKPE